ncbi:MAG: immunoglobulin-like domain-containing protein [Ekhidna sp.]
MRQILKNALLMTLLGSVVFLFSCNEDKDPVIEAPVASFTVSVDGATATFTNTSTGEDNTYAWDFGDGTSSTSSDATVTKQYTEAGTFTISLLATNDGGNNTATGEVVISAGAVDQDAPVITLVGESEISLAIGSDYEDAGATANDNVDGNVTANIEVTGTVNTLQPGVYTLAYNVSDAAGNAATEVIRTVTITYSAGLLTNGDFETGDGTGWIGNALDVRTEGGNSFAFANVETAGNGFDVNISQVVPMGSGNTYRLSFNASSDGTRTILAGIGLNEQPFTNKTETVDLTATEQRFSYELTANFGSDNSRIIFDMGADVGVVVIDNVTLELVSEYTVGLPLDFENEAVIASPFNGAAFAFAEDPADASNKVGQITNIGAGFEGVTFSLGTDIDLSTDKQISMQFNSSAASVPVLLKLEGTAPVELTATAATTGWQELTFDFSASSGTFNGITVFVDGPGATTGVFYVDDIKQEASSGGGGSAGDELATNGDFEAGDISGWASFPTAGSTFTAETSNPSSGTYSGRLNNTTIASAAIIKQANLAIGTVVTGDEIQITFDARGAGAAGGVSFAEFFSEINGGGTSSNEILGGGPLALDADPAVWKSFSFTATAGSDVSGGITLQFTSTTGGDASSTMDIYFDNVSIKIVSSN